MLKLEELKNDRYLLVIIIIAVIVFIAQIYFVSKVKFVGTADPANYAEVAENVILGKGFVMNYINEYFVPFNSITHPEEYGFPGVSLLMIPSILLFGKTALSVKLPSMIIGVILFPVLVYFLGKEFFDKRIGFLSAVSMLFLPSIFPLSFGGERDVMYAFFLVAGIYFFYKGIKEEKLRHFLLMGAFLGFSYLIRQPTLVVIPVLIIIYYVLNKKFSKQFFYGLGLSALVMAPWLLRNYLVFGDPFFTVNKYGGWIIGYFAFFEDAFFRVYWNTPKPSFSFLLSIGGIESFAVVYSRRVLSSLSNQLTGNFFLVVLTFIGLALSSFKKHSKKLWIWIGFTVIFAAMMTASTAFVNYQYIEKSSPIMLYDTLIFISSLFLLSLPFLLMLFTSLFFFTKNSTENKLFLFFWLGYILFFTFIWQGGFRYMLVLVPFFLIYSWFAVEKTLRWIGEKTAKFSAEDVGKLLFILLFAFVLLSMQPTFGKFLEKNPGFPYKDTEDGILKMQLAENVLGSTEKDAVIMGCDVPVFHFYNGRKYVEFPSGSLNQISAIMRIYNVSYFTLLGCERRAIDGRLYSAIFGRMAVSDVYEGGIVKSVPPEEYGYSVYKLKFTSTYGNNTEEITVDISRVYPPEKPS